MVVRKGIPQLPSGLFYDTGLLFSYVVAAFVGLAGFGEAVARFPSIFLSLLSVAVTFRLGTRFFSPAVGLLAAALLSLAPEAVMWGARSRPYAQFQLWVIVGVWALAEGVTHRWRGRWRVIFWLAVAAAALSHLAGLVFMLCSLVAILPAWLLLKKGERQGGTNLSHQVRSLWPDGLSAIVLLGGIAALTMAGNPIWTKPITSPPWSATEGISLSSLVHVDWMDALQLVGPLLLRPQYLPWTVLLLVNLVSLLRRAATQQLRRADAIPLYLQGVWILSVLALMVVSPWHRPHYVLPLQALFFLLGSAELATALGHFPALVSTKQSFARSLWLPPVIIALVVMLLWAPLHQMTTNQEFGYDLAFRYVQAHWDEKDAIMTFNTSGSYIYLGQSDYYPTQIGAWLIDTPAGPVERYTGAQWIESVAQLDAALARSPRTWYVIDQGRFAQRVSLEMQEAIGVRFRPAFEERGVRVFLYEK
jgi:4-amino-4-deoxy-L-arabinose transferase-like glycosyltransferase